MYVLTESKSAIGIVATTNIVTTSLAVVAFE